MISGFCTLARRNRRGTAFGDGVPRQKCLHLPGAARRAWLQDASRIHIVESAIRKGEPALSVQHNDQMPVGCFAKPAVTTAAWPLLQYWIVAPDRHPAAEFRHRPFPNTYFAGAADIVSTHNHIHLLQQYRQHEQTIHSLMESMMTSLSAQALLRDPDAQQQTIDQLSRAYPFVELIYSLDEQGVQLTDSVYSPMVSDRNRRSPGKGSDRSKRPYVVAARECPNQAVVTRPYLSSATHQLTISSVQQIIGGDGRPLGYLVINFNLQRLVSYLNGDQRRSRLHPWFQWMYGVIGGMLVLVAALLLYSAAEAMFRVLESGNNIATGAFGIVIMITLGMSIFDLGKTILEEEVLVSKDIHHHDTTRRTIARFMAAIIIAVSIEALLLMFKSLLNGGEGETQLISAVWMLMSAVAMMTGLGIYLRLSRESDEPK